MCECDIKCTEDCCCDGRDSVLVVVDMQNDFIDGSLGSDDAKSIVKNVVREISSGKYNKIIVTLDTHELDYDSTLEGRNLPIRHCIEYTAGHAVNKDVMEALYKFNFDECGRITWCEKKTFGSIGLAQWFEDHDNKIKDVTFCGLCTDICVVSNAILARATLPNTDMYFVEDACAGTSEESHDAACKVMESCQIKKV